MEILKKLHVYCFSGFWDITKALCIQVLKRWLNYSPISLSFPLVDCLFSYSVQTVQKLCFFVFSVQNFLMGVKKFLILYGFATQKRNQRQFFYLIIPLGATFGIINCFYEFQHLSSQK